MSYAAYTKNGSQFIKTYSLEDTLPNAIEFVAVTGMDAKIVDLDEGEEVYGLEADTKVDDADKYFPVIVHLRGE